MQSLIHGHVSGNKEIEQCLNFVNPFYGAGRC